MAGGVAAPHRPISAGRRCGRVLEGATHITVEGTLHLAIEDNSRSCSVCGGPVVAMRLQTPPRQPPGALFAARGTWDGVSVLVGLRRGG